MFQVPCANHYQLLADLASDCTSIQSAVGFESSRVSDMANHRTSLCKASDAQEIIPAVTIPSVQFAEGSTDGLSDKEGLNPNGSQQSDVSDCPEFSMSIQQLGSNFGCIPLTPIVLYQGTHRVWQNIPDVLQAHRMIRDSGIPNILGLCIPVNTNLEISSWKTHLCDYFDKQLVDLIEFGFPLDFDRTRQLESTFVNHASARNFFEHVDKYSSFLNMWTNTAVSSYAGTF